MDTTNDPIRPSHYGCGEDVIECIDYIESHALDFLEGNVVKYVTRYQEKNGLEDLKKAKWYLERLIQRTEKFEAKRFSRIYQTILENRDDPEFECLNSEALDGSCGTTD
jgi:hypothetical protein